MSRPETPPDHILRSPAARAAYFLEKLQRDMAEARAAKSARSMGPTPGRFQRIRRELRLTQSELAVVLSVSLKTLQGWEQGRAIPKAMFVLLEVLRDFPDVRRKLLGRLRPDPRR